MVWYTFETDEGMYGPDSISNVKVSDTLKKALEKAYKMAKYGQPYGFVYVTNQEKHVGVSWKRYRPPYIVESFGGIVRVKYKNDPWHRLMSDGRVGEKI